MTHEIIPLNFVATSLAPRNRKDFSSEINVNSKCLSVIIFGFGIRNI